MQFQGDYLSLVRITRKGIGNAKPLTAGYLKTFPVDCVVQFLPPFPQNIRYLDKQSNVLKSHHGKKTEHPNRWSIEIELNLAGQKYFG